MLKTQKIFPKKVGLHLLTFFIFVVWAYLLSPSKPLFAKGTIENRVLELDQAIYLALKNSPLIHSQKYNIVAKKKAMLKTKGTLLPKITAYTSYTRFNLPTTVIPISGFGPDAPEPVFSRDQYRAGISLYFPIYKGGRVWNSLKIAEKEIKVSLEDFFSTKENLIAQVVNTFNKILFLKDFISAQEKSLYALKVKRDHVSLMLKLGRVAPLDLMEIDTRLSAQRINIFKAKEELLRTKQHLCYLIGISPDKNIKIKGTISIKDHFVLPDLSKLDVLVENRSDVIKLKKLIEKAKLSVQMAKAQNFPNLEMVGDYGRRAGWGFNENKEVWSLGVQLSFNIFSGGSISASILEAKAKVRSLENRLKDLKLLAKKQILSAISSFNEVRARIDVAKKAEDTAEEAFRIQSLKYETGACSVTDMLNAQASWANAQANLIGALFDRERAIVEIELYSGTILSRYNYILSQK
jgi:outer membrane protein TolC